MKYKKFDVAGYRNALRQNFSGADGWDNFSGPALNADGWNADGEDYGADGQIYGADGDPALNADGYYGAAGKKHPKHAAHAAQHAPAHQEEPALEIDFNITNASSSANGTVIMFGSNIYLDSTVVNYGSSPSVSIVPQFNVGYAQILRDTSASPFTVGRVRMQSVNPTQVTQNLTITSTNIYGESYSKPINMVPTISQYQFQQTITETNIPFDITPNVYFSFIILPGTSLLLSVFIKNKVNPAKHLVGKPAATSYGRPAVGGLKPLMIGNK
jgi:hypothetical protein